MLLTVNEKSTAYLTVTFKDKAGNLAAPQSLTYRIDNPATGVEVRADTALTASDTVEITLTPADHTLAGASNERRRVTVKAVYGASDALNSQYDYQVLALAGVA